MNSGTYCLVMELNTSTYIQVGKLGLGFFPKGYYVYVGSALNGLQKRTARHLSPRKKKHWHIDYFLEYARTIGTRAVLSSERRECAISEKVKDISQGIPMTGFGSSDCSCATHLYLFSNNPLANQQFKTLWIQTSPWSGSPPILLTWTAQRTLLKESSGSIANVLLRNSQSLWWAMGFYSQALPHATRDMGLDTID